MRQAEPPTKGPSCPSHSLLGTVCGIKGPKEQVSSQENQRHLQQQLPPQPTTTHPCMEALAPRERHRDLYTYGQVPEELVTLDSAR
jgi:hypothetical protein